MEGAPNSESGSSGDTGVPGMSSAALASDVHLAGGELAFGKGQMAGRPGWLYLGARESRESRPGLT